jgi:hypothetical protein
MRVADLAAGCCPIWRVLWSNESSAVLLACGYGRERGAAGQRVRGAVEAPSGCTADTSVVWLMPRCVASSAGNRKCGRRRFAEPGDRGVVRAQDHAAARWPKIVWAAGIRTSRQLCQWWHS